MIKLDNPQINIGEVTLIGTGGGYGESCLIHLGNKNWVLVDSCENPKTRKAIPLEYLEEIGVDVKTDLKLIVCTHWHDDHIKGISSILEKATNADFSFAKAIDRKKFLQMVTLDYQKINKEASNVSTLEFKNCLEIINKRQKTPKFSFSDRPLLHIKDENLKCEVVALSPSDYTLQKFDDEVSTLITEYGKNNRKIPTSSENSKSVVLFLKLNEHRILLGADMEISQDNREGWLNIIQNSQSIDKKSSLFKIPHHGSINGFHDDIWIKLLDSFPIAKLTPWNKKNKLPEDSMIIKYSSLSDRLFMTAQINSDKPKSRDKSTEKIIKGLDVKIREVPYERGIIRCRIDLNDSNAKWEVNVFGKALEIPKEK